MDETEKGGKGRKRETERRGKRKIGVDSDTGKIQQKKIRKVEFFNECLAYGGQKGVKKPG